MIFKSRLLNLFIFSMLAEVINGQSAVRYTLCRDQVVTVIPGSSGIIQYLQGVSSTPINCTLVLRGFRNRSYVSLPGLVMTYSHNNCGSELIININNSSYCVGKGGSDDKVFIQLIKGELVVQLKSDNAVNISFPYYNNGEYKILVV